MAHLQQNVWKLYVLKASKWAMLYMPISVLFYEDNGLTGFEIMFIQGVYSLTMAIFEIPSGYFSDRLGRKTTLIIGSILWALGFVFYSVSSSFYGFIGAEILLGFGASFISGTDTAMLYDTLIDLKREKDFLKFEGRTLSVGNFAEGAAGIIGVLIAQYFVLRGAYIGQMAIALIGIPICLSLVEPHIHKKKKPLQFIEVIHIFKDTLFKNSALAWNILFSSVIGMSTLTMAWFALFYFNHLGLSMLAIAGMWLLLNSSVGVISWIVPSIQKKLGRTGSIFVIGFGIPIIFIFLGLISAYWILLLLILFYMIRGIATPVLREYINILCDSDIRATVLSIRSFVIRILFFIISPLMGYIKDVYSIQEALVAMGIFILVSSLVCVGMLKKLRFY